MPPRSIAQYGTLRERIIERIKFADEYSEILGPGKGTKRRCFNRAGHSQDDKSPSLSFSPVHGGYRCHACGEKGDIFSLYMRAKGWTYPQTIEYLTKRTGLWEEADITKYTKRLDRDAKGAKVGSASEEKLFRAVGPNIRQAVVDGSALWDDEKKAFMLRRYGLTWETIKQYHLSLSNAPYVLQIPVFQTMHDVGSRTLPRIINVRKHDAFRKKCCWRKVDPHTGEMVEESRSRPEGITIWNVADQDYPGGWEPWWKEGGKVVNITGHGVPYAYPFQVIMTSSFLYLVGGELKALLLNQQGVPAICFTAGEGQYSKELLPFLMGKRVRVLMDYDDAGVKGAQRVAQVLADYGSYVEVGEWQPAIVELLPKKGDVTDLLRKMDWSVTVLDDPLAIVWREVLPQPLEQEIEANTIGSDEEVPDYEDMLNISFHRLVDPALINVWVRLPVMVSGRVDSPHAVPKQVHYYCEKGRSDPIAGRCENCGLFGRGSDHKLHFSPTAQIEMTGKVGDVLDKDLRKALNIPFKCVHPKLTPSWSSVDYCVTTPTLDVDDEDPISDKFDFSHRQVYVVNEDQKTLEDNKTYLCGGKIVQDPKSGKFALAAVHMMPTANKTTQWVPNKDLDRQLEAMLAGPERWQAVLNDLRDNVTKIYGQDQMLLAILLPFFMPFTFKLGPFEAERVCPAIMILGDTNVGKSTTVRTLIRHFGTGRYSSTDSHPTFAGLVGGWMTMNNRPIFNWGLLPTSHGGLIAMDEFAAFETKDIAELGNTITTGTAERTTAYGTKRAPAWVRLLYLTNPRGSKRLTQFQNPLDAVRDVMGTVQATGRLEYAWIEYGAGGGVLDELNNIASMAVENRYTVELARYHLAWAWSTRKSNITFENAEDLIDRAGALAREFGEHPLLLRAQARFKVARIAIAFAALSYSHPEWGPQGGILVKAEHVEWAISFLRACYGSYLSQGTVKLVEDEEGNTLPTDNGGEANQLYVLFNKAFPRAYGKLTMFVASDKWSRDDITDCMGKNAAAFLEVAQINMGLLTRKNQLYYAKDERFAQMVEDYIHQRTNK